MKNRCSEHAHILLQYVQLVGETKVQLKPLVEKAMELFAFFIQLLLK